MLALGRPSLPTLAKGTSSGELSQSFGVAGSRYCPSLSFRVKPVLVRVLALWSGFLLMWVVVGVWGLHSGGEYVMLVLSWLPLWVAGHDRSGLGRFFFGPVSSAFAGNAVRGRGLPDRMMRGCVGMSSLGTGVVRVVGHCGVPVGRCVSSADTSLSLSLSLVRLGV
jgi:hypothetical protein